MTDSHKWSMGTVVATTEIITAIEVPQPNGAHTQAFEETCQRDGDFAHASVAVHLEWHEDRVIKVCISLGAIAPLPVRAKSAERVLAGSRLTNPAVRAAAEMLIATALLLSNNSYKCTLIINLTEMALRKNRDQHARGTVNIRIRCATYILIFERDDVK